jgi:hypothetical protein
MEPILEAKGNNGQIILYENRIDITRKGFASFCCHGFDGTKSIFIKNLTAIQFKEVGKMTAGFIQFCFSGSEESKKGLMKAATDENTVTFEKDQEEKFMQIRDFIFSKI